MPASDKHPEQSLDVHEDVYYAERNGEAWPDAGAAPSAPPERSFFDDILARGIADGEAHDSILKKFLELRITTPAEAAEAIVLWSQLTGLSLRGRSPTELSNLIGCAIGEIDILLTDQVNAIIHHPRYQQLEASWRGLQMLVEQAPPESRSVKIRVLNVSWKELCRDLDNAIEFDQSHLFRKVYEEEFGTPNGEPYGVLIGDYQIRNNYDDLDALEKISGVAAAAFAPFIASADPSLLDIDDFRDMERLPKLGDTLGQPQFTRWRSLRDSEDSRFVALTMPRMLMRRPLEYDGTRIDGFRFEERAVGPDAGRYLWGSASYALGAVIMRCFETTGWLADIRGVRRDEVSGGLVVGRTKELPPGSLGGTAPAVDRFSTDSRDIAVKPTTELIITDEQERELSELGFVPLCHCHGTSDAAFYSVHSIQRPKQYDDDLANANAKICSMLQYTLCASRFAHYLKVIIRDKIGSSLSAEEIQYTLNHWISDYIRAEDEAPMDVKARYPLREAEILVQPSPTDPSKYTCDMYLKPHYQLDALSATVRLTTDMKAAKNA